MARPGPQLPAALIALTPGDLAPGDARARAELVQRVRAAAAAGLAAVLLREPELPDGELLGLARELRAALDGERPGAWLGVHDRAHVALAAGAGGVHLGFRSPRPADLGPLLERAGGGLAALAIGLSTHASDDPAEWAPCDYLFHGPVRATPSKRGLLEPTGPEGLARAVARAGERPVWGIGGLEPADVPAVIAAGARGLAVLRGVLGAPDPGAAARAYLEALPRAAPSAEERP